MPDLHAGRNGASERRARRLALLTPALALVLGGPVACGSDPTTAGAIPVATLVIAGTPTAPLRVAETAQLAVTALSSSGATISGAPVTWTSTNEAVAAVSASGLVTARAAGQAVVIATSGNAREATTVLVASPLTLTPSGGTVTLPDGSVSLSMPPGNVGSTVTLLISPGAAGLADDRVVPGTIFQIAAAASAAGSSNGLAGATLALRYDPSRLPTGVHARGLQLYQRTFTGWTPVRRSASDTSLRVVTGAVSTFGTYAVRFTPVDRVLLSGAQVDGALYVGQTTRFGAVPATALGDTLTSRITAWSSSAPTVATVDAQGNVTAVGPGTATLTATAEGTSATTLLQVLPRPTASWPDGAEWSTFRGNNRRTGYVDATLDPGVFTRRWEVTLAPSSTLNEPATAAGTIFVSTSAGPPALWALDAATGATRWSRALGEIHSVNGPAAGNGRVYVATGSHDDSFLWSFDAADGSVRFRAPYGNQWSRWPAPAVTADAVYLAGAFFGGMSAFDARDGAVLWRRGLLQAEDWTPAVDGGKAYVFGDVDSRWGVLTLDGRTGAATLGLPNAGLPLVGTPVLGGGGDLYAIRGNRLIALDLTRDRVTWDLTGGYAGVPALDGTTVYALANGRIEARARSTGSLLWTWAPPASEAVGGSVIVTRNLIFARLLPPGYSTEGGRVIALDLATRKVVWAHEADGEIALGDGLLLITSRSTATVTAIAVR